MTTCNFSQDLETLTNIPVPSEDESDYDYAVSLQDWSVSAIAVNKRNYELRKFTSDCIKNTLVNEE